MVSVVLKTLCSVINSVFNWLLDIFLWIASIAWNVSSLKLNLPFLPSDLLLCVRGTVSSLSQSPRLRALAFPWTPEHSPFPSLPQSFAASVLSAETTSRPGFSSFSLHCSLCSVSCLQSDLPEAPVLALA